MYAIVVYEFDDETYDKMRQGRGASELVAAQIAYAVATQGTQQTILYLKEVSLDDIIDAVQCIL